MKDAIPLGNGAYKLPWNGEVHLDTYGAIEIVIALTRKDYIQKK